MEKLLTSHTTRDCAVDGDIVVIDADTDARSALRTLCDNGISSAPVYDSAAKQYVGILDVRDLACFIALEFDELHASVTSNKFIEMALKAAAKAYDQPVEKGITTRYMARRHRWTSIKDGASLLAVVELMSKNKCHRLPVVNEKDEVVNIITQSMFIKFLAAHDEEVAAYSKRTIAAAACTTSPVLSIDATAPAIDAFKLIAKHNIFGIGILDADGNIVGNTSASDLKLFVNDPSTDLRQPIFDFIAAVRCAPTPSMKAVSPLFTVKSTATLSHVIAKLASTNAHRLFIVDGDGDGKAPTAVTSLSDICADICKFVDAK